MQRFTDLKVWRQAHEITCDIYRLTRSFPSDERYGLSSQLRRAAVSMAANIAEGSKRRTNADYARFLNVAEASCAEVECLLILTRDLDLGMVEDEAIDALLKRLDLLARMLSSLRARVEAAIPQGHTLDQNP